MPDEGSAAAEGISEGVLEEVAPFEGVLEEFASFEDQLLFDVLLTVRR